MSSEQNIVTILEEVLKIKYPELLRVKTVQSIPSRYEIEWAASSVTFVFNVYPNSRDDIPCVSKVPSEPPQLPCTPTRDDGLSLFSRLQGNWRLSTPFMERDVIIDRLGNFTITNKSWLPWLDSENTEFHLKLLWESENKDSIELAKVGSDGKIRAIEVLKLDSTQMTGYVKHNGITVKYTRQGS